jgi:serine/threonine protein kinase
MAVPGAAPAVQGVGRLADYELQYLDKGSFGSVFKAVRKSDGRVFALKQVDLTKEEFKKPVDRAAAIDEARMLAQLNYPHVVRHYDSFIDNAGKLNILMEYASKGSLRQLIKSYRGKPMPEDAVWRVLIHSLLGLNYIHSKRVSSISSGLCRWAGSLPRRPVPQLSVSLLPDLPPRPGKPALLQPTPGPTAGTEPPEPVNTP